jgi:L,D-transpeptidase-like protein
VSLRAEPGSERVLALARRTTDFGSPTTFAVAGITGRWAEVISPQLPIGVCGLVNRKLLTLSHVRVAIDVDLSRRELRVWRAGELRRRIEVAIGAPASPTSIGRLAVTDELTGIYTSAYGRCVLELSGHPSGCLHADEADLRWLLRRVPLGTQVVIHP